MPAKEPRIDGTFKRANSSLKKSRCRRWRVVAGGGGWWRGLRNWPPKIHEARTLRQQAAEECGALSHSMIEARYRRLCQSVGVRRLADVCETITDGDHNTPTFSDSGVRFIFVGNVSSAYLHFGNSKRVSDDYFKSLKPQRLPQRGDISKANCKHTWTSYRA